MILRTSLAIGLVFSLAVSASAQVSVHGSIRGRVVDPTGAAVPGASVTAASDAAIVSTTVTDATGGYQFIRLAPGAYEVSAELDGFRRAVRQGIAIRVNETATIDLTMAVGARNETVTVTADAPIVARQASSVSMLVDDKQIRDLPLNGRDFQKLTFLAPGFAGQRGNNTSTNQSGAGSRDPYNNYVIDGASANDERQSAGLAPGNFGLQVPNVISTEAIQEFRVITSNADATFGRGSGAQINVITKSGTSRLRGSAYEYLRDDIFDARDFFNYGPFFDADGRVRTPPFNQHLFGGTAGGPLPLGRSGPRRHFFFASYEGFRQALQQTTSLVVPTADLVNLVPGDLGEQSRAFYFGQQIVPQAGLPSGEIRLLSTAERATAIAAGFPAHLFDGNTANGEAATALQSGTSTRDFWQNALLVRTDHHLTDAVQLSIRYATARNELTTNTGGIPFTERATPTAFDSAVVQLVSTLSPSQVLELRGGLLVGSFVSARRAGLNPALAALGVSDFGMTIAVTGTTAFATPSPPPESALIDEQMTPQFSAMHIWNRGRLTLRTGADMRRIAVDFSNNSFPTPSYTFTGLVGPHGFLGAAPGQAQAVASVASATIFGTNGGPPTPLRQWRSTQQEYFAQADWQARSRLTLNLGLRYSYYGVYSDATDALSNLYAVDANGNTDPRVSPFAFGRSANAVMPVSGDRPFYQPDRNNLQPRLGAAWDVTGTGRTVVRGAWGIYHDRIFQLGFSNVTNNVPFATAGSVTNLEFRNHQTIPINPNVPIVFAVDPTIRNPYAHRVNATVDQQLGADMAVSASYVGHRGRDLLRTIDPNFAGAFPVASRPDARFSDQRVLTNASWSEYDALQIVGRRRIAAGLAFTAAYTLGRTNDDTSADAIFNVVPTTINAGADPADGFQIGPTIERPLDADFGPSELDIRHNFVASHLVQLPFGRGRRFGSDVPAWLNALIGNWDWNGLIVMRTGARFNVTLGRDSNDDGALNDRPALLNRAIDDLYARGADKTQFLVPQSEAAQRLGVPAEVTDPYVWISRNALHGPAIAFYDMSLIKRLSVGRTQVQIEANVFNLFNRSNFRAPEASLGSALFGRITGTAASTNPRQMQFGLKVTF